MTIDEAIKILTALESLINYPLDVYPD